MALDMARIAPALNVGRMRHSHVVIVGVGGAADLAQALVRCGLGAITLIDPDTVSPQNLARQGFERLDEGRSKVDALCFRLRQITPDIRVLPLARDVTSFAAAEADEIFGKADLIVATTDSFAAQSWVNRAALKYRKPAVWPGVYGGGLGGEIVFWYPGLPCYRCLLSGRYRAQEEAKAKGQKLDPPSEGSTIFDTGFVDAVTGQLVLGLLTRGADNRYGRLIGKLGDRNFLHVKLDPDYRWNGRDVIREQLGIADGNDRFFAWNVAARRDPDGGQPPCPDCVEFGHSAEIATPRALSGRSGLGAPPLAHAFADSFPSPPTPHPWDVKKHCGTTIAPEP
jgi:molybdopterin/thiamine biosynthesis adenylyltransferase